MIFASQFQTACRANFGKPFFIFFHAFVCRRFAICNKAVNFRVFLWFFRGFRCFDSFRFVLVINTAKSKRQTRGLNHCLVAKHTARMTVPRLCRAFALFQILGNDCWVVAVFAVNFACATFRIGCELHAVKLRMAIDDSCPTVHTDNRRDSVVFVGKRVNLFCEWVQTVLVCYNHQDIKLRVCRIASKGSRFERLNQLLRVALDVELFG